MLRRILELPLFVILMGIGAALMFVPAIHAAQAGLWRDARAFFYCGAGFLVIVAMVGLATANIQRSNQARGHLLSLLAAFTLLPLMLAVPFRESAGDARLIDAYFEMISSLTTTGATLFADSDRLSGPAHLWRALVGWAGGFLIWVSAAAILAPMNLGGFEVLSCGGIGSAVSGRVSDAPARVLRFASLLFPIYSGLTLTLCVALLVLGASPLVAVCHAMSTLATSGISPSGGEAGGAGVAGEATMFLFLCFALSRRTFAPEAGDRGWGRLRADPELRMGLFCAMAIPLLLFLRHWAVAYGSEGEESLSAGLRALWGGTFTVLSFLTTAGFESASWDDARIWSGLETPGLLVLGLALIGGGVATTAGGVKLLRVHALFRHGRREIELLIHPSSVGRGGRQGRDLRGQGARIAWIFFMLFALSIACVMLALSLTGLDFESAVILSVAALSTTGPLAAVAGSAPIDYAALTDAARMILAGSMVLGRLETLAIIALLNPALWHA